MSDYCQLCNTANGAHTHYCPANPANERSELASATGYAWVCISERLPDCKKVVVLFKDKSMLIANGEKITQQFAEYCQITHWLEIPATPNESSSVTRHTERNKCKPQ